MRLKNITVTVKGICSYEAWCYNGYGTETKFIYTMETEDGTIYAWKNTSVALGLDVETTKDDCNWIDSDGKYMKFCPINKGDVIVISATVKGEDEYKGQPQTLVNRVKVHERLSCGKTQEEIKAEKDAEKEQKKQEQLDSLTDGDFIWKKMPYRQFKEHYSDCETVIDSFERENGNCYIDVIVREGRLKNSGSRGRRYRYFWLRNEKGQEVAYKAITLENAIRRAEKEYPNDTWKLELEA